MVRKSAESAAISSGKPDDSAISENSGQRKSPHRLMSFVRAQDRLAIYHSDAR